MLNIKSSSKIFPLLLRRVASHILINYPSLLELYPLDKNGNKFSLQITFCTSLRQLLWVPNILKLTSCITGLGLERSCPLRNLGNLSKSWKFFIISANFDLQKRVAKPSARKLETKGGSTGSLLPNDTSLKVVHNFIKWGEQYWVSP